MKKIISLFLSIIMCLSAISVSAASVPDFMKKIYSNYTADYKVSVKLDNADEIVDFLSELEMPEEVNNYVNVKAVLESLFASDSVMNVQAEISSDFRHIKVAITGESRNKFVLNRNYDSTHRAGIGVWVDMNLDERELVLVYSTPVNEKYAVIDFSKEAPEEIKNAVFDMYDKLLNREFIEKVNGEVINIMAKYADISMLNNTCSVKFDNDAFVAIICEISEYMADISLDLTADYAIDLQLPSDAEAGVRFGISSLKEALTGIKLLGEDGILCKYILNGKTIKSVSEKYDISLCIADIYEKLTGKEWSYSFSGDINMTIDATASVSGVGKTKVDMPEVSDENSFNVIRLLNAKKEAEAEFEWEEPAVSYYVWGNMETEVICDGRYYMPLRRCIEYAYEEAASISYDDGLVTIVTDCGETDKDINVSLRVDEDSAMVNGVAYNDLGAFKKIDNVVYASKDFYEKCLGWTLDDLQKNLISGSISYGFYTNVQ